MSVAKPKVGAFGEMLRIFRPYWLGFAAAIALGIVGGMSVTGLLAIVNNSLYDGKNITYTIAFAFVGLSVLSLVATIVSDVGANYIGQRIIAGLRKELGARVLAAPISKIERYRSHKLIPVLTHDVDTISDFAFEFAPLLISFTITLGCLGYLAYLSLPLFGMTLCVILLGTIVVSIAQHYGYKGFFEARDHEDRLQKHYQSVVYGAKELRIDRDRRLSMLTDGLQATADRIRDIQVRAISIFITARAFGSMLFFIVIGVLLLVQQSLWPDIEQAVISGFVLVLLYLKGPLEHLIGVMPIVSRAQIAFVRIAELFSQFSNSESELLEHNTRVAANDVKVNSADIKSEQCDSNESFSRIALEGVEYHFPKVEGSEAFIFGPADFIINRGEITFIVGENGSGKTTLIKLLLGLYEPDSGHIALNETPIDQASRDDYRQLFATVFADYFLFDDLQKNLDSVPESVDAYLKRLEIDHKVSVKQGEFTTTDLSTGQRKRLALVHVWLSDRPILVFDEWAADQDPAFRKIFYSEILPDLKKQGKTIIVISHDDRYFHIADTLLSLSKGKIINCERKSATTLPQEQSAIHSDATLVAPMAEVTP